MTPTEPGPDCALCPRLAEFRSENARNFPEWFNAPVPSFGPMDARLLIVGLAPGLRGANRTGRPFTGDYAGDLLYQTLARFGFTQGQYDRRPDDGLEMIDCRIVNGVRCVPPQNRPSGVEIRTCRQFLVNEIASLARLQVILALGRIAHDTVLAALGERLSKHRFAHGALHALDGHRWLADSYHCSRYNTNTGRLTERMFEDVFVSITELLRG